MDGVSIKTPSLQENTHNSENSVTISQEQCEIVSSESKITPDNSEYDSAGSYSDEEPPRDVRSRASDQGDEHESDGDSVIEVREEGDGQESLPPKKVDHDEDKKNPQYIPKRGTFYEHDDRTADDVEEETKEPETDKDKKKVWQSDKKERWAHDKFNDDEQTPKSVNELIDIYGYDIRNEEGPPKARRRRRYGRGPNKYTRNWEDEDAYNKPVTPKIINKKERRPREDPEEFPPLGGRPHKTSQEKINEQEDSTSRQSAERIEQEETSTNQQNYKSEHKHQNTREYTRSFNSSQREGSFNSSQHEGSFNSSQREEPRHNKSNAPRVGSGRVVKQQPQQQQPQQQQREIKKEPQESDVNGFTSKMRFHRPNLKKDDYIQSQNFTNKNSIQELERDISKLTTSDSVYKGRQENKDNREYSRESNKEYTRENTREYNRESNNNHRQGSVPPRLQNEQKGGSSKRYSSMRQRSLPENAAPPPSYPNTFYPNEPYQQEFSAQTAPQPMIHPSQQIPNAQLPPPQMPPPQMPPPQMAPIPQVPVTAAPLLQGPFPQPFPQAPPPFLQPQVAATPFIQQQQPSLLNYVQSHQGPQFAPNFPQFQQQFQPVVNNPPTELYQPPGGITYYSTDQQIIKRSAPQKRRKAAIPIIDPSEALREKGESFTQAGDGLDQQQESENLETIEQQQ